MDFLSLLVLRWPSALLYFPQVTALVSLFPFPIVFIPWYRTVAEFEPRKAREHKIGRYNIFNTENRSLEERKRMEGIGQQERSRLQHLIPEMAYNRL